MRKKIISEQQIIDTADKILKEHGLDACTMRTVAAKSGIAVGTLYNYYDSREALLEALFQSSWNETINLLAPITETNTAPDQLIQIFYKTLKNEIVARKGLGELVLGVPGLSGGEKQFFTPIKNKLTDILVKILQKSSKHKDAELVHVNASWLLLVIFGTIRLRKDNFQVEESILLDQINQRFL